jgi:hypothetical protein
VGGGGEGHLGVAGALRGFVRAELHRDAPEVLGRAQQPAHPRPLVGELPEVAEHAAVPGRAAQVAHGLRTYGALQVNVQVGFGQ